MLKTIITAIVVNDAFDKFILAIDVYVKKSVFIINLNSFQIERIALSINPVYIISRQQYFIIADKQGSFAIYDVSENTMSRHKFSLPEDFEVRAIACNQNLEIIAATWSSDQGCGSLLKGRFID